MKMTGVNVSLRQCLREAIPEIEIAAQHLNDAVSAHLRGERDLAEELFRQADDKIVGDWLDSIWGKETVYNLPRRIIDDPTSIPKDRRDKLRYVTTEMKRLIHQRDGHYCRFCKIPVIRAEVRSAIHRVYPNVVPWGTKDANRHAAFKCLWAQYDHVLPHARGGLSDLNNVYLTCAACNYGRQTFLLAEFDLLHPTLHAARQGHWDGLERFR